MSGNELTGLTVGTESLGETSKRRKRGTKKPEYARYSAEGICTKISLLQEEMDDFQIQWEQQFIQNQLKLRQIRRRLVAVIPTSVEDCNTLCDDLSMTLTTCEMERRSQLSQLQDKIDECQSELTVVQLGPAPNKRRKVSKRSS